MMMVCLSCLLSCAGQSTFSKESASANARVEKAARQWLRCLARSLCTFSRAGAGSDSLVGLALTEYERCQFQLGLTGARRTLRLVVRVAATLSGLRAA